MKKTAYTIQIIPEKSEKTKSYRISKLHLFFLKIFVSLLLIGLGLLVYQIISVYAIVYNYPKIQALNTELIKKQKQYEKEFELVDSIYLMNNKIKLLLDTYFEKDSSKINALLEKNKFNYKPSSKIHIDFDGVYGWVPNEEKMKIEKIPNILPVIGIISKKYAEENNHKGTDFAAQIGDPVFATASGKVIFSDKKNELGLTIDIDHENGYISSYSHLNSIKKKKGNFVKKGDIIGFVGNTGKTSGPHLHYSILKNGSYVNPEFYFNN